MSNLCHNPEIYVDIYFQNRKRNSAQTINVRVTRTNETSMAINYLKVNIIVNFIL